MIRRAFWLVLGAVAGIMGYRRVSALGRKVPVGWARQTARFTRDVREGMDLYKRTHESGDDMKDGR